jgi:tetratricopeptide (TPR) repeat protein
MSDSKSAALLDQGFKRLAAGDNNAAADLFRECLLADSACVSAHVNLACLLADSSRVAEGLAQLDLAIATEPVHFEARANRAFLSMELPDTNETTCQYFRDALEIDQSWWDGWYNLGNLLSEQGSQAESEAIACYQKAVKLRPKSAEAHNNLGILLQVSGNLELATQHCQQAVVLMPSNARHLHNLASCLHQAGRHQQAMQLAQKAVHLNPDYHEALAQLAALYKESNQSKHLAPEMLLRAMQCPNVGEVKMEEYGALRGFLLLMLHEWPAAHEWFLQANELKKGAYSKALRSKTGAAAPPALWQAALDGALYQGLLPVSEGCDFSSNAVQVVSSACTSLAVVGTASLNSMFQAKLACYEQLTHKGTLARRLQSAGFADVAPLTYHVTDREGLLTAMRKHADLLSSRAQKQGKSDTAKPLFFLKDCAMQRGQGVHIFSADVDDGEDGRKLVPPMNILQLLLKAEQDAKSGVGKGRQFVLQEGVDPPALLDIKSGTGGRKFGLRVHALVVHRSYVSSKALQASDRKACTAIATESTCGKDGDEDPQNTIQNTTTISIDAIRQATKQQALIAKEAKGSVRAAMKEGVGSDEVEKCKERLAEVQGRLKLLKRAQDEGSAGATIIVSDEIAKLVLSAAIVISVSSESEMVNMVSPAADNMVSPAMVNMVSPAAEPAPAVLPATPPAAAVLAAAAPAPSASASAGTLLQGAQRGAVGAGDVLELYVFDEAVLTVCGSTYSASDVSALAQITCTSVQRSLEGFDRAEVKGPATELWPEGWAHAYPHIQTAIAKSIAAVPELGGGTRSDGSSEDKCAAAGGGSEREGGSREDTLVCCTNFQVFGYDFLVDQSGTPYLLEINASPQFGDPQKMPTLREKMVSLSPA